MKEDIIKWAREAGIVVNSPYLMPQEHEVRGLERFATLVAAAEREACAQVAEDSDHVVSGRGYYDQLGDADATARNIAIAIRARGQE